MARIENVNIDGTDYDVGKIASTSNLGVVQVGSGLNITPAGVLSASGGEPLTITVITDPQDFYTGTWSGATLAEIEAAFNAGRTIFIADSAGEVALGMVIYASFGGGDGEGEAELHIDNGGIVVRYYLYADNSCEIAEIKLLQHATTNQYGVTQLSTSTSSTSTTVAATPSAVKAAYDLAASKGSGTITGVSANGTSVATSGVANIPAASTSAYGVTQLSSSTSSTSTTLAATPSAVKAAYDLANGKVSITLSTTDIGQGASLAANTLYGVYE